MKKQKALDPITVEVIKNALTSVANEMSISLRRTSMSPILYEMLDFCVDLYNSKTELIAEGRGSVAFQGTVNIGINKVVEHVGRENVEEGDVFIAAWSYFAGSHNPDVLVFKPIFYDKKLFGYAATKAHWADIGASSPFA
ncbi:MAG: hydantoinase B/oxoprolinase family protein, partial [Desulfatiglandales bacterium]|nr:hydantoinase B/oxoprolinase family protein [Desulfatiglandales bacterium]